MFLLIMFLATSLIHCNFVPDVPTKQPTVLIAILARNKAHTLPYFLSLLQDLSYPKHRISLWIRSDHNQDNTIEVLRKWVSHVEDLYHSLDIVLDEDTSNINGEFGPAHWSSQRFSHVISLRETAFKQARKMWADYIMFLDCDVFLKNRDTLQKLMSTNHLVTAPMLKSDGLYSNFWCGMTSGYYYKRTEDYKPILSRERVGCFHVPMVHSCVLVDLRAKSSDNLTFNSNLVPKYDGPKDDIITFAISANRSNVPLYVCNNERYGYVMVPLEQEDELKSDLLQLTNLKLEVMNEEEPLYYTDVFTDDVMKLAKDKWGFSEVFMINLVRRPERRRRMQSCFEELGLDATTIDAVDGS